MKGQMRKMKTFNEYYEIQCPSSESWQRSLENFPEQIKIAENNNIGVHHAIVNPKSYVFSVTMRYDSRKDFTNFLAAIMNQLEVAGIESGEAIAMQDLNETSGKIEDCLTYLEEEGIIAL